MRRLAALLACSLVACAAEVQLPPPPPAVVLAPPAPAPPPGPPPLLVVPRAEASLQRAPSVKEPAVVRLRSEGKRHALERTADGVLVFSEERGVVGFLKSPVAEKPIRWAGFVEDDAVLVVAGDRALRAATVDEALAGRFEPVSGFEPAVELLASAGKIALAAARAEGGAFQISTDGGRTFTAAKRPAKGKLLQLAARADGFAVLAFARDGKRAEVLVGRGAKGFGSPILAEGDGDDVIDQGGDTLTLQPAAVKGQPRARLGLGAGGRWAPAEYPASWLHFAWSGRTYEPQPPVDRPGLPKRPPKDGEQSDLVGGVMGGIEGASCAGVGCLRQRPLIAAPPALRAFHDGVCARGSVVERTETYSVLSSLGSPAKELKQTITSCRADLPALRTSTLIAGAGEGAALVKAPTDCAEGRIFGTERAAFVRCGAEHGGRPRILHVAGGGALTDVVTGLGADDAIDGAESASDGTTLIFGERGAWLCRVDAPACVALPRDGFLAARPLPGGRALVARAAGPQELLLELRGEPGATAVRVRVPGNLIDVEVTAEGHVRLWQSEKLTSMSSPESFAYRKGEPALDAFLVGADGALVGDPAAKRALLDAVAAARAKR